MASTGFYVELGRRVRTRREELRLSQEVLAEQLGLKRTSVANLEGGNQRISAEVLALLASALLMSVDELTPTPDRSDQVGRLIDTNAPEAMRKLLRTALLS